eukprot:1302812-Alexandrium_andersonii.AAC.1
MCIRDSRRVVVVVEGARLLRREPAVGPHCGRVRRAIVDREVDADEPTEERARQRQQPPAQAVQRHCRQASAALARHEAHDEAR